MALILSLLLACGSTSGGPLTPESAAKIADQIHTSPTTSDAILRDAGTDAPTFEAYLFTVAADADLSRRYLAARH